MKKLLLLFLALSILSGASLAEEEEPFVNPEYTPEFIAAQEEKLAMVPALFPKNAFQRDWLQFTEDDEIQFEGFQFLSLPVGSQQEITITADSVSNSDGFSRGWQYYNSAGAHRDFYYRIDFRFLEQAESAGTWLFFQYTDGLLVGEENRKSAEIMFPDHIDKYTTDASGRVYTNYYDLSSEYSHDEEMHTLEVIRLNGYASFYIDGRFIVGFEDGFDGLFYPIYGVGLHPGGEHGTFAFQNLELMIPSEEGVRIETDFLRPNCQ